MSSESIVSVIIIFLNAEKFLEEAIESVFAQTYDNWELLLVDDGSTDGSTRIALKHAEKYPGKVFYLEHDSHLNRGMSASRNLGIRHARGNYIAFLDADDVWFPQKLEQQVAILNSQPEAAMVYGRTQIWYTWTNNPKDRRRDYMVDLGIRPNTLVKPPTLVRLLLQGKYQTPTTCNAMLRREIFEEIGGFIESFRGMHEDQVFFAKLGLKFPAFVANECWARYRQHPDSCCVIAEKNGETDAAWLHLLDWITEYLIEQGVNDKKLWNALKKAWRPVPYQTSHGILGLIQNLRWHIQRKLIWTALGIAKWTLPAPAYRWIQMKRGVILQDTTQN
ncbi:MAG: glycosyltransferase family 2 protein [Deltaproteobacteria bacterium]|nr:glycosyltransferase family 2 protein [Deltaproteobacteria bacterium]